MNRIFHCRVWHAKITTFRYAWLFWRNLNFLKKKPGLSEIILETKFFSDKLSISPDKSLDKLGFSPESKKADFSD